MNILVMGGGAMGSALAGILCEKNKVGLWCRRPEKAEALKKTRINEEYLPGYSLPNAIDIFTGEEPNLNDYDCLLLCIPTQHLRATLKGSIYLNFKGPIVNTAKGIEIQTLSTPGDVLVDLGYSPKQIYCLSGPSHAEEMAMGIPTSLVVAGEGDSLEKLSKDMSHPMMRVYYIPDRIGVELGGALKNVIAIAAGMSDGMGFGINTKSVIITRGLAEIRRYALLKGAKQETFFGLSCIGDLIATCCSPYSRNRAYGEAQAKNPSAYRLEDHLVEGAYTVNALIQDLQKHDLELPLCEAVYRVLDGQLSAKKAMESLIARPTKEED